MWICQNVLCFDSFIRLIKHHAEQGFGNGDKVKIPKQTNKERLSEKGLFQVSLNNGENSDMKNQSEVEHCHGTCNGQSLEHIK